MILRDYAGFTNEEIDGGSFDTLNNQEFASMGLFLPSGDTSTVHDVLERVACCRSIRWARPIWPIPRATS